MLEVTVLTVASKAIDQNFSRPLRSRCTQTYGKNMERLKTFPTLGTQYNNVSLVVSSWSMGSLDECFIPKSQHKNCIN